jgi:3-methyladenine DNA glycosylase AlkD
MLPLVHQRMLDKIGSLSTESMIEELKRELLSLANPKRAVIMQRYFKTGRGQYGEGDEFLGISMPDARKVANKYSHITLDEVRMLLHSKIHEERMVAVLILLVKCKDDPSGIAKFNVKYMKHVNNWDLVDVSAPRILGLYLLLGDRSILYKLAKSPNLWERRASILSTLTFIRNGQFEDTFKIAEILLQDKHDLMHKAVGWMLREVGNYDLAAEEKFLKHYKKVPRTMLTYAIEKFPENKRRLYLDGML